MTTTLLPPTTRVWWIAMLGYGQDIDIVIDRANRRVFVDDTNLELMASSIVDCGIMSEAEDAEYASAIRSAPDTDGLHDVTDVGGGWGTWLDHFPDAD